MKDVLANTRYKLILFKTPLHPFHAIELFEVHTQDKSLEGLESYQTPNGETWFKTDFLVTQEETLIAKKSELLHSKDGAIIPELVEKLFAPRPCYYIELNQKFILFHFDEIEKKLHEYWLPLDHSYQLPSDLKGKLTREEIKEKYSDGHLTLDENSPKNKIILTFIKESLPLASYLGISVLLVMLLSQTFLYLLTGYSLNFSQINLYASIIGLFLWFIQIRLIKEIQIKERSKASLIERKLISAKHIETIVYGLIGLNILINHFMGKEFLILMALIQIVTALNRYNFTRFFFIPLILFYSVLNSINFFALI